MQSDHNGVGRAPLSDRVVGNVADGRYELLCLDRLAILCADWAPPAAAGSTATATTDDRLRAHATV
jgi:hypothetical protein